MSIRDIIEPVIVYPPTDPIILRTNMFLRAEEMDMIRKEFEKCGHTCLILPKWIEPVYQIGKWIYRSDDDYAGGGYYECSGCGQRYSIGAYFEPQAFRYCPRCGHRMEEQE